jgi:hypothetical protein
MCLVFIPVLSCFEQYYIKNHVLFIYSINLIVVHEAGVLCCFRIDLFYYLNFITIICCAVAYLGLWCLGPVITMAIPDRSMNFKKHSYLLNALIFDL